MLTEEMDTSSTTNGVCRDDEQPGPSGSNSNSDSGSTSHLLQSSLNSQLNSSQVLKTQVGSNDIEMIDLEIIDTEEIQVLEVNNGTKQSTPELNIPPPFLKAPQTHFKLSAIIGGDMVYGLERGLKDPWREAIVEDCYNHIGKSLVQLRFIGQRISRRKEISSKKVSNKHVAYFHPSVEQIPTGFRVIARTMDRTETGKFFFAGIVAENPTSLNNYRYLIFFDDGLTAYCHHDDVRIVPRGNAIPKDTWSEIHPDTQLFIKEFIELHPNNFKATVRESSLVTVEWNGKWWPARVVKIDCSLLKLKLVSNGVRLVIWRGSDRLLLNYERKKQMGLSPTTQLNLQTTDRVDTKVPTEYEGKAVIHKFDKKLRSYPKVLVEHECSIDCQGKFKGTKLERIKIKRNVSPLINPLYCGWDRGVVQDSPTRSVYYDAPCGKRLWNLDEIQKFINESECDIGIDCFTFEFSLDCLVEFQPTAPVKYRCDDISGGCEWVPVSKINTVATEDSSCFTQYAPNTRLPCDDVFINTQQEFLVCCDCTDNCQDKQKCACFRLTFEHDPNFLVTSPDEFSKGYLHRRLFQKYAFGLYECNNWCKCRSTCINRVVQNGLQWKLQVFNTASKGYSIRTLQDIPQGSFICVYNGDIMCGSKANERGSVNGDEYLANLDFIESAEKWKDDYEPFVLLPPSGPTTSTSKNGSLGNDNVDQPTSDSNPNSNNHEAPSETRLLFGEDQDHDIFAIDAKAVGNIGRYINHSCNPNLFSQDVFIDTHDIRFPWVSFFAMRFLKCGTELTWDYNYTVGMADGKSLRCKCGAVNCRKRLL